MRKVRRPRKAKKRVRPPRKPRETPIEQGSYRQIYEWFFGKLILYKPAEKTIGDWMEYLFDYKQRDIIRYKAVKSFKMPGHFCVTPNIKIQGIGYRDVKPGAEIYVRLDGRNPDRIDVEWLGGVGKADQIFALTSSEWGWVQLHCEESERVRK